MLDVIDEIKLYIVFNNIALVCFDVIDMFPNIDNQSGLEAVSGMLSIRKHDCPPAIVVF